MPQTMGTVVRGLLHSGSVTLFYGPPKSGKSFLLCDLFLNIAAGLTDWMGHPIVRPGPVLMVACEGHAGYWKRLQAAAIDRGWDDHSFPKQFVLGTGRPRMILISERTHTALPHPDDVVEAVMTMKANGGIPVAVGIDTVFRSVGEGNVNASDHMNAYLASLAKITDLGPAVAVVHHETKAGGTPAGSVTLTGGADTVVATKGNGNGLHEWFVEMAKDDAETEPRQFALEVIDVGNDLDDEPQSSCVVRDKGPGASPGGSSKRSTRDIVRNQMLAAYDRLADAVPSETGFAHEPVRKVKIATLRDELRNRGILELDDKGSLSSSSRSDFRRARLDLINSRMFVESGGFIWRTL
jgi:hypothetical protein